MTYLDLFNIISEPWISVTGIRKIARCSRDTAIVIRNKIEEQIISSGKGLPQCKAKYVPTRLVLDYLNLDANYIIDMAIKEKKVLSFRCYANDVYGIRKQFERCGFTTKREAQAAERKFLDQESIGDESILFSKLWNDYNDYIKLKQKKQSYRKTVSKFKNHILPYFENYRLDSISARVYTSWQIELEKKGYSYKYLSSLHGAMVTILNYAIKFFGLKSNIAQQIGNFSKRNIKPSQIDFWTYEEYQKFINIVDDLVYKTFYETLYFTGMRQGEAIALKWRDIKNGYIDIYKTISKEKEDGDYIINTPKTKSSIRKIRIDSNLINDLNKLKEYYKNIIDFNEDWYVFGGIKPITPTTIGRRKDEYCIKAGVKKIRIHDLRHSHASLLLSNGVPITVISKRLGHSTIQMTLNTYAHLIPEDEDKAINMLNSLKSSSNSNQS